MKVKKKTTGALEKVIAARNTLADPTPVAPAQEPDVVMVNGIPMDPKVRGGIELQRSIDNGDYTIQGGTLDIDVFENTEDKTLPTTDEKDDAEQARLEQLAEIEKEIRTAQVLGYSATTRHKKRNSIITLYQGMPDDVILEFPMIKVSVTPRIPYTELMDAIQWAIDFVIGGRAFVSEPIKTIMKGLAIVKFYTDLEIDEADDMVNQYDIIVSSGALDKIKAVIDQKQLQWFNDAIDKTSDNIVAYQNSAAGIIATLGEQATDENSGLNKVMKTLSDNKDTFEKMAPFIEAYQELGGGKPLPENSTLRVIDGDV